MFYQAKKVTTRMTVQQLVPLLNICKATLALIKGYLHYKTITSPNMSSEAQIKNFFIS